MTKPLYFYNGTTFELVGPTTPQSPIAYQTSAPTAPATGDLWIDSDGDVDTYNRQLTRYYYVATASQTTITGIDANGLTLAYVAGSEAVYVNGALQVRGVDYTATNGTSITGLSALGLNDVVEVFAYTAFTVANAYTKSETDGVAAAAAGLRLVVPTSVAVGSGSGSVGSSGAVTFSGASSVSLNDVFSATYTNYKLIFTGLLSTSTNLNLRVRVSGTDLSGSNYNYQYLLVDNTSVVGARNINETSMRLGGGSTSDKSTIVEISNPFETKLTDIKSQDTFSTGGVLTATTMFNFAGNVNNSTSYTGFTIFPGAGTITGTVRVYGYKD